MTELTPPTALPVRPPTRPSLWSSLSAGLRAVLLLRPESRLRLRPSAHFWLLSLLTVLLSLLVQLAETPRPLQFNLDALRSDATTTVLLLGFSHAVCAFAGQAVRAWSMATLLAAALVGLALAAAALQWLARLYDWDMQYLTLALGVWWLGIVLRIVLHVLSDCRWWQRVTGAVALAAILWGSWIWLDQERYFYTWQDEAAEEYVEDAELPQIEGSAEQVMYAQTRLLDEALSRIRAGDPTQPELFVLAFGGDGNEAVFRNEVDYIEQLFSRNFAAGQRVLKLVNSPATVGDVPLATLSNLRSALKGLREKMDSDDLLFLYLTSHGSPDHLLFVNLLPLTLDQISPEDLADALREAEIGVRVVLISACYSGGFIEALSDPRALVITAARADRPSFGCGSESDITYFGRAFLVDALNQQRDFIAAFKLARRLVTELEKSQHEKPSRPQIAIGSAVEAALTAWREQLPKSTTVVPFLPRPKSPEP